MMKRVFILICVVLMAIPVFAGSTVTKLGDSATQEVTLKIGDDLYVYNVGFSTDGKKAASDLPSTALTLKDGDRTIAENSTPLYVWWDILTADKFKITLSMDAPLTEQQPLSGSVAETIDYAISGELEEISKPESADPATSVNLNSSNKKSVDIINFAGGTTVANSFKGNQKLTIATVSGALQGKPEGDYKSTLTLTVTNN